MFYNCFPGIGFGLCFSPSVVIIANYFNKYRAIASGISLAGGGLGGMVFPYLIQYLLREYGLRDALLVYGAIMLNICPCGLLMRPIQDSTTKTNKQLSVLSVKPADINTKTIIDDMLTFIKQIMRAVHDLEWCMFKQWNSIVLFVVVFFAMFGYNSLFNIIPAFLDEIEFTKDDVAFVLFIFGLSDLIGRILFGMLMNVFPKHRHLLFTLTVFLFGSGIVGTYFIHTKVEFCVLLGCYGVFAGGYNGTLMVMAVEYVDLDRLPSTWGFMCWSAAMAFLLNPVATGALRDNTGTWTHTFLLSGTMSLTAVLILIFKSLKDRRKTVPKTETITVERY
ncbi:monocarboxylate transporter 12-like [Argopecten irradians]|uniref:monocarboxylate transporter 12-like n=1 Tax=Argopecten irradians TaxID=31199 RepID=UPI00371B3A5B